MSPDIYCAILITFVWVKVTLTYRRVKECNCESADDK
jgi:hypothetical protein